MSIIDPDAPEHDRIPRPQTNRVVLSLVIGLLLIAASATLATVAYTAGAKWVSLWLMWPNTVLQSLVPRHNIGTPDQPFYEGTALNALAYLASLLIGFAAYSLIAYTALSRRRGG